MTDANIGATPRRGECSSSGVCLGQNHGVWTCPCPAPDPRFSPAGSRACPMALWRRRSLQGRFTCIFSACFETFLKEGAVHLVGPFAIKTERKSMPSTSRLLLISGLYI